MSSVVMEVLNKVQISKASYQKQLKILKREYDKVSVEQFFVHIRNFLKFIFSSNTNVYVEKVLEFLAHFIAEVTPDDTIDDDFTETGLHPLLTLTIKETLKYHRLVNEHLRCNSCLFIRLILSQIGPNKNLDNEICDLIEEAMLERTLDPKPAVRFQAVLALIRLQDPMNADSPVNKAYLSLIVDASALIRAEVVKNIAPYNISIPQIVNRLRDIDPNVRIAAVRKCADLSPKSFKILERQHILTCGITENNAKVKNVFIENLLPKWLNAYQNNYILFLNALKLDADETDITNTEKITKDLFDLWLRSTPVTEIISVLPLDQEKKVISLSKLSSEAVAVWYNLVMYLRDNGNMEEYLEDILPDLTPFCKYVESIIDEKSKSKMEEWEYLDYYYTLDSLFGIAAGYDFADEVGRKTLHQLTLKILREENLLLKLKRKLVTLSAQTAQKTEDITNIMCHVISDIQAPLIEVQVEPNAVEQTNKECQKAEIKIKIIRLEAELEDAAENQEYLKAETLKNSIGELKLRLQELSTSSIEMVKVTKEDHKTVCECLDLLISLLALPNVKSMTSSLVAVKDEFVIPLLSREDIDDEINWRVLKCIAMFCILDESVAQEYVKKLCIPIITYRHIPNYNKHALMISIKAITDIFRLYGSSVFGGSDTTLNNTNNSRTNVSVTAVNTNNSRTNMLNTGLSKRRLYGTDQSDESVMVVHTHLETIIEVILDMLDAEIAEIRNVAIEAISKLILNGFAVSALLISRLILKWYNPLTAQASDKSQQLIGVVISNYVKNIEGAKDVIANAIIPTLQSIVSAPTTSPLAAVDVENLLLFLSNIIDADDRKDLSNTHINMAHMFIYEIMKKKNDLVSVYLSKLLLYLDISKDNIPAIKELKTQTQKVLDDEVVSDKWLKRNLLKFFEKLNSLERLGLTADGNLEITENTNVVTLNENSQQNEICDSARPSESHQLSNVTNNTRHITITNLSSIQEENEDDQNEVVIENTPNTDDIDEAKSTDDEVLEPDKNMTKNTARSKKRQKTREKNMEQQDSGDTSDNLEIEFSSDEAQTVAAKRTKVTPESEEISKDLPQLELAVESVSDKNEDFDSDDENEVIAATPQNILPETRKRTKEVIEDTSSDTDNNNKSSKRRKKQKDKGNTYSKTGDIKTSETSEGNQERSDQSKNREMVVNITPRSRISSHLMSVRRNLRSSPAPSSSSENSTDINQPVNDNVLQIVSESLNLEVLKSKPKRGTYISSSQNTKRDMRNNNKPTYSSTSDKEVDDIGHNNQLPTSDSNIIMRIDSIPLASSVIRSSESTGNHNKENSFTKTNYGNSSDIDDEISSVGILTIDSRKKNTSNSKNSGISATKTLNINEKHKNVDNRNSSKDSTSTSNAIKSTTSQKEYISSTTSNFEIQSASNNLIKNKRTKHTNVGSFENKITRNSSSDNSPTDKSSVRNTRNKVKSNNNTDSKVKSISKSTSVNSRDKSAEKITDKDSSGKNTREENTNNISNPTSKINSVASVNNVRSARHNRNNIDATDSTSSVKNMIEKSASDTKAKSKSVSNNLPSTPIRSTRRNNNNLDIENFKTPAKNTRSENTSNSNTNTKSKSKSIINNPRSTPDRRSRQKINIVNIVDPKEKSGSSTSTDNNPSSSSESDVTSSAKNRREKSTSNTNTNTKSTSKSVVSTPVRSTRQKINSVDIADSKRTREKSTRDNINSKSKRKSTTNNSSTPIINIRQKGNNTDSTDSKEKSSSSTSIDTNSTASTTLPNRGSQQREKQSAIIESKNVGKSKNKENLANNRSISSISTRKTPRVNQSKELIQTTKIVVEKNEKQNAKNVQKNNTKVPTSNSDSNTSKEHSFTPISPSRSKRRKDNEKVTNKYAEIMSQLISKRKNSHNSPKTQSSSEKAETSKESNLPDNENWRGKRINKELFPAKETIHKKNRPTHIVLDSESKIRQVLKNNNFTLKSRSKSVTDTGSKSSSSPTSRRTSDRKGVSSEKSDNKVRDLKGAKRSKRKVVDKRKYSSDDNSERSSPKRLRLPNKRHFKRKT